MPGGDYCRELTKGCRNFLSGHLLAGYAFARYSVPVTQRPLIERYAEQCARYGVRPTESDYLAGWAIGYSKTGFRQPN
jgi:hypothetical protein